VTRERPIAVELEIDEDQPLSGRLREPGGPWRAFAGWIGLAGAIDGVLGPAGGDPSGATREEPDAPGT
jgi:hypothetical protein